MKKLVFGFTLSIMVFAVACQGEKKKVEETAETTETEKPVEEKKEEPAHWGYDGESSPEHWTEIEKNSSCGGSHQSPIDILTDDAISQASGFTADDIHYAPSTIIHDVTNNGHSVQYNFEDKDNYVTFKDKRYDLAQFHFHAASEHAVNGMHYPLVIHMVHVSEDKNYVVLAIMISEGEESTAFEFLETYLPVSQGETKSIGKEHTFANYILDDFSHYYYQGSLTTPPCTEGVNWFIFKDPILASSEQVKAIADLMPRNNYRPTQEINDRKVYFNE